VSIQLETGGVHDFDSTADRYIVEGSGYG
jgi:hypothetical protein